MWVEYYPLFSRVNSNYCLSKLEKVIDIYLVIKKYLIFLYKLRGEVKIMTFTQKEIVSLIKIRVYTLLSHQVCLQKNYDQI